MKKIAKILNGLKGRTVSNKYVIFVPIKEIEDTSSSANTLLLETATSRYTNVSLVPGAVLRENESGVFFRLAYVPSNVLMADFDVANALNILGKPLNRKEKEIISEVCFKAVPATEIAIELDNGEW
jgi:hypothetical protein